MEYRLGIFIKSLRRQISEPGSEMGDAEDDDGQGTSEMFNRPRTLREGSSRSTPESPATAARDNSFRYTNCWDQQVTGEAGNSSGSGVQYRMYVFITFLRFLSAPLFSRGSSL